MSVTWKVQHLPKMATTSTGQEARDWRFLSSSQLIPARRVEPKATTWEVRRLSEPRRWKKDRSFTLLAGLPASM